MIKACISAQHSRSVFKRLTLGISICAFALLGSPEVLQAAHAPPPKPDAASAHAEEGQAPALVEKFWARRVSGYFKTRDGVDLKYSVLLPGKTGRFPVAMLYSGYDTGSMGGAAYLNGKSVYPASLDKALVEQGYAVMGVNKRATGCSGGEAFDTFGTYGKDGADAVEFAAQQSWSDGNVGMYGWSWAGMSQLMTASEKPPHLKAVAPGMVVGDIRGDNSAPGGVTQYYFAWTWAGGRDAWPLAKETAVTEKDSVCLENIERNLMLEKENSLVRNSIAHPVRDAWADTQQLNRSTHNISVPVLAMETFQDEQVSTRGGYFQETLDPTQTWILQSNGPHSLYASLEFRKILIAFLNRFVKGVTNGFETRPRLSVWMETNSTGTQDDEYLYLEAAKPGWQFASPDLFPAVEPISLYMAEGAQLQTTASSDATSASYTYPTPGPSVDANPLAPAWGPQSAGWRKGSLVYTSAPFDRDILAYGEASVDLWLSSSDAPDTDLQVTLTEVRADGQEMYLQRGWLRLSHRAVDEARSTAVRPVLWDQPSKVQVLESGVPVLARVPVNKFAALLRKGSRLRVWIDTPSETGGYRFDYVSLPAINEIWHGGQHVSRLVIGALDPSKFSFPPTAAPCGAVMMQPCRPDPLQTHP